jgi:hypothetical protein
MSRGKNKSKIYACTLAYSMLLIKKEREEDLEGCEICG